MNRMLKGYLFVIGSAVIFGLMPLGAKIIYANGLNPMSLVFFRNALALPALYMLQRPDSVRVKASRNDVVKMVVLAMFGSVVTPVLLFSSYNYISSGMATTLHFVYPAIVIVLEMVVFHVKVSKRSWLCVGLCLAGIALFYTPDGSASLFGVFLALLSGITFAFYIVLLPRFDLGHLSGFQFSFYLSMICSASMAMICGATGSFRIPVSLIGWIACTVFSLVLCIGAVILFRDGTLIVGGQKAAILSTFEPITSVVVGLVVFHEVLGLRTAIGSVLILAATILIAMGDAKKQENTGEES